MKPKHQRLAFVLISLAVMGLATTLILRSFNDSLVFFFTPTQWQEKAKQFDANHEMRIGGLVKKGSVKPTGPQSIRFIVTDLTTEMPVTYTGMLPALFREGQGVVAQGTITDGTLAARTILAKHDENYMPKEVADALKKSGRWKEGQ